MSSNEMSVSQYAKNLLLDASLTPPTRRAAARRGLANMLRETFMVVVTQEVAIPTAFLAAGPLRPTGAGVYKVIEGLPRAGGDDSRSPPWG